MAILINNHGHDNSPWIEAFTELLPQQEIRSYPQVSKLGDIEYAVIWNHPHGDLIRYPNLKAILLLGAGADFLNGDTLPNIPIVRLIDENMARDMALHSLYWILHFHRDYYRYSINQKLKRWQAYDYSPPSQLRIGILGLGEIGRLIAKKLQQAGYSSISAWVRSPRPSTDVELYIGEKNQQAFFAQTDILLSLLPLTRDTESFINAERLAMLPRGSFLINIGRGAVIDEVALRQALDTSRIKAVALDVFREEPLPEKHWMWSHPAVFITPHSSGMSYASSAAIKIAENIHRIDRGEAPFPLFDSTRGY